MDAVERLMDGHKADLVFTDPPYNVDYEGYTEEKLKIQGDKMTPEQFQEFLLTVFRSYLWALKPGGSTGWRCSPAGSLNRVSARVAGGRPSDGGTTTASGLACPPRTGIS